MAKSTTASGPSRTARANTARATTLRFKQGNGDGRIRIKTLNGTVEVCNR